MDLHAACRSGDLPQIKVAYFTDPSKLNEKDPNLGWCPLYRTVICGHFEATSYLLQQGADPNVSNTLGETPLHQAADNSQYQIAELLLSFKANSNIQQRDGDTPLHHAAFRGDVKMTELLLNSKADPNIANFMFGRTPLHYAADCGHTECLKVLIAFKADPLLRDKQGKSAFELCNTQEVLAGLREAVDTQNREEEFSPIGEVTTYFVNDTGEGDRNSYITETFGAGRQSYDIKVSIVSPVSEQSEKSFKVSQIFYWLEQNRLEECYEALNSAGYYSIDIMVRQMIGPMPLTDKNLRELGVFKPGHRRLLLVKIEEEAGISGKLHTSGHKSKSKSWVQCCASNMGTLQNRVYPSLADWLDELGLSHLHQFFMEAGYDSYQTLLEIQGSSRPLNSRILEQEVRILEMEQRMMILRKLQMEVDAEVQSGTKIAFDSTQKVGCDSCRIM